MFCGRWEDKVKPSLKEAVSAYFKATAQDSTGAEHKVLVKEQRSGKWIPRSGLQWAEVNEAVRAYLWMKSDEYSEGETMPILWTTTGFQVMPCPVCSVCVLMCVCPLADLCHIWRRQNLQRGCWQVQSGEHVLWVEP